jgi:hypothetical protein
MGYYSFLTFEEIMNVQEYQHLQAIANSNSANPVFVTAAEGQNLLQAGLIAIDATRVSPLNPNAVLASVTEVGMNYLLNNPAPTGKVAFAVQKGVALPTPKTKKQKKEKGERVILYPFDSMEIFDSFHVPVTAENPEPWKNVSSQVNVANKKYRIPLLPEEMITVEKKTAIKDAEGNFVLGEDGKRTYAVSQITEKKMVPTRKFALRQVGAGDPSGAGARVWRVELTTE